MFRFKFSNDKCNKVSPSEFLFKFVVFSKRISKEFCNSFELNFLDLMSWKIGVSFLLFSILGSAPWLRRNNKSLDKFVCSFENL